MTEMMVPPSAGQDMARITWEASDPAMRELLSQIALLPDSPDDPLDPDMKAWIQEQALRDMIEKTQGEDV